MDVLDTLLPSDELLHEFNLIDEHTTLGNFNLEEGEQLIMEAEEMLLSDNLELGAINSDEAETSDNLEGTTSADWSLHSLFEEPGGLL